MSLQKITTHEEEWPSLSLSTADWQTIDQACQLKLGSSCQQMTVLTSTNSVEFSAQHLSAMPRPSIKDRQNNSGGKKGRHQVEANDDLHDATHTSVMTSITNAVAVPTNTRDKPQLPKECLLDFDSSPESTPVNFDYPPVVITPYLELVQNLPPLNSVPVVTDIIFDLETTGMSPLFGDEIIEIAACTADGISTFDVYVLPHTLYLSSFITEFTGIDIKEEDGVRCMYADGKKVAYVTLDKGIRKFVQFLVKHANGGKVNLVGHNCINFDFRFLYPSIEKSSYFSQFEKVVYSFTDTLRVAKVAFPGRQCYKQDVLVQEIAKETYVAHNAKRDSLALAKLLNCIKRDDVLAGMYTYTSVKAKYLHWEKTQDLIGSFWFMTHKRVISKQIAKKMAESGLAMSHLKKAYLQGNYEGLYNLLTEKNSLNKPRVTARQSIINNIYTYFSSTDL